MSLKVSQVAELLGVSYVTVYKKIKKLKKELNGFVYKRNKATYLTLEAVELIKNDIRTRQAALGKSKTEETFNRRESLNNDLNGRLKQQVDSLQDEVKRRDGIIAQKDALVNKLIEQQSEDRKYQADERHRSDIIIMQLTTQLKETRVLLEDLRQQHQEAVVPGYETVDAQSVQEDIMEVDAAGGEFVQDVGVEVCEVPLTVDPEPVRESIEVKKLVAEPVKPAIEKQTQPKQTWGFLKRLWVNLFQPELLRET